MKTLYKMGQSGLLVWKITILDNCDLYIAHGPAHGKLQEEKIECDHYREAERLLNKRYDHKVDREGYTTTVPARVPDMPMLAQEYKKHGHKLPPYVIVQPKLDGIRCIGTNEQLISRRNTPISACPHVLHALKDLPPGIKLDGELYAHGLSFQEHLNLIKRDFPLQETLNKVQYHVYDLITDGPYHERYSQLVTICSGLNNPVCIVPNIYRKCPNDIKSTLDTTYLDYEGIILRDPDGLYERNKRSTSLQKLPRDTYSEYQITDIVTSKTGREQNCAIFVCKTKTGLTFKARPKMTMAERGSIYRSKENYIGWWTRINYKETNKNGTPRQPIAEGLEPTKERLNG